MNRKSEVVFSVHCFVESLSSPRLMGLCFGTQKRETGSVVSCGFSGPVFLRVLYGDIADLSERKHLCSLTGLNFQDIFTEDKRKGALVLAWLYSRSPRTHSPAVPHDRFWSIHNLLLSFCFVQ